MSKRRSSLRIQNASNRRTEIIEGLNVSNRRIEVLENEYAKLVKSLYSGLPNEVDFAFNSLTLMSSPGPHVLTLEKNPFLLALMIAHAGVFSDDEALRNLAEEGWRKFCDLNLMSFGLLLV